MAVDKKIYASAKSAMIQAVVNGLYSFKKKDDASALLSQIRQKFILSRLNISEQKD